MRSLDAHHVMDGTDDEPTTRYSADEMRRIRGILDAAPAEDDAETFSLDAPPLSAVDAPVIAPPPRQGVSVPAMIAAGVLLGVVAVGWLAR